MRVIRHIAKQGAMDNRNFENVALEFVKGQSMLKRNFHDFNSSNKYFYFLIQPTWTEIFVRFWKN